MAVRKITSSRNDSKNCKTGDVFRMRQSNIIKKAAKLFIKKGYAQTSMRDIAKATRIDVGNLYYFIKSKEEILYHIYDMFHFKEGDLFERFKIFEIEDPVMQLQTAIREIVNFGGQYRDEIALLYRESRVLPKVFLKDIMTRESNFIRKLEKILINGVEKGVFNIEDTSFTSNLIIYQLSVYSMRRWNMKRYAKEELIDLFWKNIIKSIAA